MVLDEIKRRRLQFKGTPLDQELIQEASRQNLCVDNLDKMFDNPIIQLKVRALLGQVYCDYIGIPRVDTECMILDTAAQKRAFRNCVLKMISSQTRNHQR